MSLLDHTRRRHRPPAAPATPPAVSLPAPRPGGLAGALAHAHQRTRTLARELLVAEPALAALTGLAAQVEAEHGPMPSLDQLAERLARHDQERWKAWLPLALPALHTLSALDSSTTTKEER